MQEVQPVQEERGGRGIGQGAKAGFSVVSVEVFSDPTGSSAAGRTFRAATDEVGKPVLEARHGLDIGCGLPQEDVSSLVKDAL